MDESITLENLHMKLVNFSSHYKDDLIEIWKERKAELLKYDTPVLEELIYNFDDIFKGRGIKNPVRLKERI